MSYFIDVRGCDEAERGGCLIRINVTHILAIRWCTKEELENYQRVVAASPAYYVMPKCVICTVGGVNWFVQDSFDDVSKKLEWINDYLIFANAKK